MLVLRKGAICVNRKVTHSQSRIKSDRLLPALQQLHVGCSTCPTILLLLVHCLNASRSHHGSQHTTAAVTLPSVLTNSSKKAMQQHWASCVGYLQPPASPCKAAGALGSGRQHPPSCSDATHTSSSSCYNSTHGGSSTIRRWSKVCSFLVLLHAFQIMCGRVAGASAAATSPPPTQTAPCVECNDCVTSSCLRICMPSCKTASSMAEGSELSIEQCKHKGQEGALDIATAACKLAQASCQVSPKAPMTFQSVGTVSGSQCAALANAGCQKMASAPTYSPCGANQYFGHRTCSGRQFSDIYRVKVGQLCLAAMHALG